VLASDKRQLQIQNDSGEIEAGIKVVDVGRKIFDLLCTSGSGTNDVVDISFFLQGWFCSRVRSKRMFLDMPDEQTRIIGSQIAPHRGPCLVVAGYVFC